jgi:hypothetical protein
MHRIVLMGLALALASSPSRCGAQRVVEHYDAVRGFLQIGPEPERRVPRTERGHSLLLPEGGASSVQGVVVFVDARRFDVAWLEAGQGSFDAVALAHDLAVLHITTGNPLDFLFEEGQVADLVTRIGAVLRDNDLRDAPLFLAGLSLGGTRALRIADFIATRSGGPELRLRGAAVIDAPLDMERLLQTERRAAALAFHPVAEDEGRWVTYLLETHLGDDPGASPSAYRAYSPYAHAAPDGGNAAHLIDLPIRAYHEPDVDWWIENRGKSYYDMNSLDLAGLVNTLRILGNEDAELVTTHGRREGYAEGASPHTWSIVDNRDLVRWFLSHAGSRGPSGSARVSR